MAADVVDQPVNAGGALIWIGAASFAMFAYLLVAWVASGDARPTTTGVDPVPGSVKVYVWIYQVAGVAILLGAIVVLGRRSIRARRLTLDACIFIAWTVGVWTDPLTNNYLRTQMLYKLLRHQPGLLGWPHPRVAEPQSENLLPEPLVAYGGQLLIAAVGTHFMRRARARWPQMGKVGLILCGLATIAAIDFVLEIVLIRTQLYAYPGSIRSLSLFAGTRYQFPVYETLVAGALFTSVAALRFFVDDRGRSIAERGIDEQHLPAVRAGALRLLAVTGFVTLAMFGYSFFWYWASFYGGPYAKDFPSYMVNDMCGPDTGYACRHPEVPLRP